MNSLLFFTFWRITAQLKFTAFYGPMSMKERCGAPLLDLARSYHHRKHTLLNGANDKKFYHIIEIFFDNDKIASF